MKTWSVTYRYKGSQCASTVAAFDEKGARARFVSNMPGVPIIGVRPKASNLKRR